jgi:hypothetical protein
MKICLTGHKNGLGATLYRQLSAMYDVVGIDFPDDLTTIVGEDKFYSVLNDSDVVILNAPIRQIEFLKGICEHHYNDPKKVIVIGSVAGSYVEKVTDQSVLDSYNEVKHLWDKYIADQKCVKSYVTNFQHTEYFNNPNTKLQLSCLSLQQLDDPRSELTHNRMPFDTVVSLVCDIIDNDYILNTEVWHA